MTHTERHLDIPSTRHSASASSTDHLPDIPRVPHSTPNFIPVDARKQAFLSAGILIAQMPAKVMGSVPPVLEAPAPGHNQRLPRSTFRGATSFSRRRDRDILATG